MAVKFSQFNLASTLSDIDYLVGFKSTNNIQIPVGLVAVNTTYTVATAQSGLNETLTLTGSDASTDVITFTAGGGISLTDDGAGNGFTIASTVSGETYDLNSSTNGSNVNVNLTSTSGTDNSLVTLTPAGGLTITQTGNVITLDTSASGSGTVTSVGLTMPGAFAVGGSPITSSGTLAVTPTGGSAGQFLNYLGAWATPASGAPTKTVDQVTIANATTGTVSLSVSPTSEAYTDMYVSGVYQNKSVYSLSGSTITLDSSAYFPNGSIVEVVSTT